MLTIKDIRTEFNDLDRNNISPDDITRPIANDFEIFAYCRLVNDSESGKTKSYFEALKASDPKLYAIAEAGKRKYMDYLEEKYPET